MPLALLLGAAVVTPGSIAIAQTKAALPTSFEVASIRTSHEANRVVGIYPKPGRFVATNIPLKLLIDQAYHLNPVQLQGVPSWARSRRYTIQAVMPAEMPHLPPRQMSQLQNQMLRSLLADRFKLKVHWATKLLPVYDLVVAKGGPKMKLWSSADYTRDPSGPGSMRFGVGSYTAWGNPSSEIAGNLTAVLGRKVIDKTGLTGRYDFDLKWTPWRNEASRMPGSSGLGGNGGSEAGTPPAPDSSGPSIYTAIQQQLGLRLKPAKAPLKVLVVDHVEPPTPNWISRGYRGNPTWCHLLTD